MKKLLKIIKKIPSSFRLSSYLVGILLLIQLVLSLLNLIVDKVDIGILFYIYFACKLAISIFVTSFLSILVAFFPVINSLLLSQGSYSWEFIPSVFGFLVMLVIWFAIGYFYGLLIKKFEKYKSVIKSFTWTFAFWYFCFNFIAFTGGDETITEILVTGKFAIYFRIILLVLFFMLLGASFLMNFLFNELLNWFNNRWKKYEKFFSIFLFIIKFAIMGIISWILILLALFPLMLASL